MALSTALARTPIHNRSIQFQGYLRDDGLWDIEAQMQDTRTYGYLSRDQVAVAPLATVHHMLLRVTLDDRMVVRAIETGLPTTPFPECALAAAPMEKLVGVRLGNGWRSAIDEAMGGIAGCTHLRELLFNVATAAFQTIPIYRNHQARLQGVPMLRSAKPPPHFGKCMSWDFNGPVVQRVAPEFYRWKPPGD